MILLLNINTIRINTYKTLIFKISGICVPIFSVSIIFPSLKKGIEALERLVIFAEPLVLHNQIDLEMLKCTDFYFRAAVKLYAQWDVEQLLTANILIYCY
jgi:hypothetical protein